MEQATMIRALFKEQQGYLNYFFENVDLDKTQKIFEAFFYCKGSLIFTGIGKSGIIAQKLAMTFLSTGTKSFYIPPIDALHGDLGIVDDKDIFVFLSKSGQTEELISLIPHVRNKGASIISLVSNDKSFLYSNSDLSIHLPIPREICPFDLAPTTSTAVQLIYGDVLAVMMMRKKNFSLKEFVKNHPAGAIGKRISLHVKDLMIKDDGIPFARKNDLLIDVLYELSEKKCGCLLIVDDKKELLGIFTDGDLRRSIQKRGAEALSVTLSKLMTPGPTWTNKDQLVIDAMKQMEENPKKLITVLPVLEKKKVIGILRMHDILQAGLS